MKRIMLSAAALTFIISGAFAKPANSKVISSASEVAYKDLTTEFSGLSSTIPSNITITKHFEVTTESDDDIIPAGHAVMLSGKHFDETAYYNEDGVLLSYKEKVKDAELPFAVKQAIEQKHANAAITKDKEYVKDMKGSTTKVYDVKFKDGRKHYKAVINEDGTIEHMHRQLI